MKKIIVVGIGISANTLTLEALKAINNAQVLAGAPRLLGLVPGLDEDPSKRKFPCYLPEDIAEIIRHEDAENFAVLVSGDVGFYSAATGLLEALGEYDVEFIPGISVVNAFFAKLKLPWQNAAFASLHGRKTNIVDTVRRNHFTLCLTGKNINEIVLQLVRFGFGQVKIYVGENIGDEAERIYETAAEKLAGKEFPSLTVLLFENNAYDDRTPSGLPDSLFSRLDGIPMTKAETRAVIMSKLNLRPASVCYDIGAGTGSVSIEMALSAYNGHVYAIEKQARAISLIDKNCESFHVGNITTLWGEAPAALDPLPPPDTVFIGGSSGELGSIIGAVLKKNADVRMVISAVTPETVSLALSTFKQMGIKIEIIQLNIARGKQAGNLHLMEAQNPITIISVGGKP